MTPNLNLNWLRTFEAAARHLSFTAASKELGLTQTAVSLQIKSLETKLGHDLFVRRPKSLRLTEIAKAYLPAVRNSLLALNLSTDGLFGPDQTSTIVVRASIALTMWLVPQLKDFQKRHPGAGIKFVTAIWADTLDTQHVDVDIILAPSEQAGSHLEKLSEESLVPICGNGIARSIKSVEDLLDVHPIHIVGFDDHWSRYLAAFDLHYGVGPTRLQVDTFAAACEMVACDLGCAIVLERFADNAIETARPVQAVGEAIPLQQAHYLVRNDSTRGFHPGVEAFNDWLRSRFIAV